MPAVEEDFAAKSETPLSIFDLIRRNEHDAPISPLSNWVTRPLVIANSFLNSASRCVDDTIVRKLIGCGFRFQLNYRWNPVAHIFRASRSIRLH